jgi:hypothetical protein
MQSTNYGLLGIRPLQESGGSLGFINEVETVFFHIGDIRRHKFIRMRLRKGGEVLNVNADGGLSVEPNSTNAIDLRLRDD